MTIEEMALFFELNQKKQDFEYHLCMALEDCHPELDWLPKLIYAKKGYGAKLMVEAIVNRDLPTEIKLVATVLVKDEVLSNGMKEIAEFVAENTIENSKKSALSELNSKIDFHNEKIREIEKRINEIQSNGVF